MKKQIPDWLIFIIQYSVLLLFNCANVALLIFCFAYYFPTLKRYFFIAGDPPNTFLVLLGDVIVGYYLLFLLPFIILFLLFEIFYKKKNKVKIRPWLIVLQIIYILLLAIGVLLSSLEHFYQAARSENIRTAILSYWKPVNQQKNKIPDEENPLDSLQSPSDL